MVTKKARNTGEKLLSSTICARGPLFQPAADFDAGERRRRRCIAAWHDVPRRFFCLPQGHPLLGDRATPQTRCARKDSSPGRLIVSHMTLRRHGGGQDDIFIILVGTMAAELPPIAGGHELTQQHQKAQGFVRLWYLLGTHVIHFGNVVTFCVVPYRIVCF